MLSSISTATSLSRACGVRGLTWARPLLGSPPATPLSPPLKVEQGSQTVETQFQTKSARFQEAKEIDGETLNLLLTLGTAGALIALFVLAYQKDLKSALGFYKAFKRALAEKQEGIQLPIKGANLTLNAILDDSALEIDAFDAEDVEALNGSALELVETLSERDQDASTNYYQSLGEESGLMIFSGSANVELAREVCAHLNMSLGRMKLSQFADGEISLDVLDDVRSRDVYIFQSVPNASSGGCLHSHLMELFLTISAIRRASAERITAVLPYLAYSRQEDLDDRLPKPLAVADMSRILYTLGVDRVVFVDHHAPRAAAFFPEPIPVTNLLPQRLAIHYLSRKGLKSPVVVATENTAGERAKSFWSRLKKVEPDTGLATLISNRPDRGRQPSGNSTDIADEQVAAYAEKSRKRAFGIGESKTYFVGDVDKRDCVIVDDIIDSGVRVCNAVAACKANGARRVFVYVTHGVLSQGAISRLDRCDAEEILMTNSIELPTRVYSTKFKVLNISKLIAEVLRRLHAETSSEFADSKKLGSLYRDQDFDADSMRQAFAQ